MPTLHHRPDPVHALEDAWLDIAAIEHELACDPFDDAPGWLGRLLDGGDDLDPPFVPTPEPSPCEPRVSFADYLDIQAAWFRSQSEGLESSAAAFVAGELAALADRCRYFGATTPAELEARREQAELDAQARVWDAGYAAGLSY